MNINAQLAKEFTVQLWQIDSTIQLLDEGATIPFIARYRKEVTGSLDDNQLRDIFDRLEYLRGLEKRKAEVISSIEEQEKMTDELRAAILAANALVEVEDIYRPYRPKRRTRGSIARERGLEALAELLMAQDPAMEVPLALAAAFVDPENEVADAEAALAGASDIIAEDISDHADIRKALREFFLKKGKLTTEGTKEEDSVYSMYYEYGESVAEIPKHRVLAINRGEKEDFLRVRLEVDTEHSMKLITKNIITGESPAKEAVNAAAEDSFSRLIFPSIENEVRNHLTDLAQEGAIELFSQNLHQLLMQPPVKGHVVMGLDPGLRTGCKVAVVDATGKPLDSTVIYPVPPNERKVKEAKDALRKLVEIHKVDLIAIGNGTASRETELFTAEFLAEMKGHDLSYMVVSEAGASVYSASKLASEEFPEYDVTIRSAISIARRMQDPLAELVKIDPKSIGVGQYQHDMPQNRLDSSLGGVVESCVNTVGVDLNTASVSLLAYVAGVNTSIAKNIVGYREENGAFTSRKQLLKVPRLGPKAYVQCAGFLRIPAATYILDNTAVHPESYKAAETLLKVCQYSLADVKEENLSELPERVKAAGAEAIAGEAAIGLPTLHDIVGELLRPGRDLRDSLPPPILRTDVLSISDLKPEMEIIGTIRNVIDFGAFVDIGVHQDGLVHISELSSSYVKHPLDVVKVGDIVKVRVLSVDEKRQRIGLTMKNVPQSF